jgi:toxin ParE1/3/4
VTLRVRFSEQAWQDAEEIYNWIAAKADSTTAENYISRIIDFCETLRDFPNRGTPRDDIAPRLRTMSFERRATIAYIVEPDAVRILRVLHHGRDLGKAFAP